MKHRKRKRFLNQARSETPPQMRGKDALAPCLVVLLGITPACAGKRGRCARRCRCRRDQPRVCGEKPWTPWEKIVLKGSPPRVRGKALVLTDFMADSRITPACAGKSASTSSTRTLSEDHPRVCGEKWKFGGGSFSTQGSPPRVRGKVFRAYFQRRAVGITPACAGKRREFIGSCGKAQDHPRVCGEKRCFLTAPLAQTGSPPRVRGKVLDE